MATSGNSSCLNVTCPGPCPGLDSGAAVLSWSPVGPPIATEYRTVDNYNNVVDSSTQCNFWSRTPTVLSLYDATVTVSIGTNCDLEIATDSSTVTPTQATGAALYFGAIARVFATATPNTAQGCPSCDIVDFEAANGYWYTSYEPTALTTTVTTAPFESVSANWYLVPGIERVVRDVSYYPDCTTVGILGNGTNTYPGPSTTTIYSTIYSSTSSVAPAPSSVVPPPSSALIVSTSSIPAPSLSGSPSSMPIPPNGQSSSSILGPPAAELSSSTTSSAGILSSSPRLLTSTVSSGNPNGSVGNSDLGGELCDAAPVNNFYDVAWFVWEPVPGAPPLATHYVFSNPDNGQMVTSTVCNTSVYEEYYQTQSYDCVLGRGPYQTLDKNCNIVVGLVFTGDGATPTPGTKITQIGPSGTIIDLGTSISANDLTVTNAAGSLSCAGTTTTKLPSAFFYTGAVTLVPSFPDARLLRPRQAATAQSAILPDITKSPTIGPFSQAERAVLNEPNGVQSGWPGASTTTVDGPPAGQGGTGPSAQPICQDSASPESSSESTTTSSEPITILQPPTTTLPERTTTPRNAQAGSASSNSQVLGIRENTAVTRVTTVCQVMVVSGQSSFLAPELSVGVIMINSTATETAGLAGLASTLTAGVGSYICSVIGGCGVASSTDTGVTATESAVAGTAGTVATATEGAGFGNGSSTASVSVPASTGDGAASRGIVSVALSLGAWLCVLWYA